MTKLDKVFVSQGINISVNIHFEHYLYYCEAVFYFSEIIGSNGYMNQKIKAALSSTLVFPGVGQFLIKKPLLGAIFSGISFISFCVIFINMMKHSQMIVEKIQLGEIPLDIGTISALFLEQQAMNSDSSIVNIAWIMLVSSWIISIIHSSFAKSQ